MESSRWATVLLSLAPLFAPAAQAAPSLVADLETAAPQRRAPPRPSGAAGGGQLWLHTPESWPRAQLWHTSSAGARRLLTLTTGLDARPWPASLYPEALLRTSGPFFADPERLVRTDGTVLGSYLLPEIQGISVFGVVEHEGAIFQLTSSTAGSVSLTRVVLATGEGELLFSEAEAAPAGGPWSIQGELYFALEQAGTKRVYQWMGDRRFEIIADVGTTGLLPERGATARDGSWLFMAHSLDEGIEPWRWDADGPRLVADLVPGRRHGLQPFPFVPTDAGPVLTGARQLYLANGDRIRPLPGTEGLRVLGAADGVAYGANDQHEVFALVEPLGAPTYRFPRSFVWWRGAAWGPRDDGPGFVRLDPSTGEATVVQDILPDALPTPEDDLSALYGFRLGGGASVFTGWSETGAAFPAGEIPLARSMSSWPSRVFPFGDAVAILGARDDNARLWRWSPDDPAVSLDEDLGYVPSRYVALAGGVLYGHGRDVRFVGPGDDAPQTLATDVGSPSLFTPFVDRAVFSVRVDSFSQLWESDGTAEGTRPLPDAGGPVDGWSVTQGELHAIVETPDGPVARRYAPDTGWQEPTPIPLSSRDLSIHVADGVRFALGHQFGRELPTVVGVVRLDPEGDAEVVYVGWPGTFRAWVPEGDTGVLTIIGNGLSWRSDRGTLQMPCEAPRPIARLDEAWLFSAETREHGRELWRLDADGEMTLVADLVPGRASGDPGPGAAIDGVVVFSAQDADFGRETWVTDGTPAGTRLLFDLAPGDLDGIPPEAPEAPFEPGYHAVGDHVYFAGWTPEHGVEPRRFPRDDLRLLDDGCRQDAECPADQRCVGGACIDITPVPPEDDPPDDRTPSQLETPGLASDEGCGCRSAPAPAPTRAILLGLLLLGLRTLRRAPTARRGGPRVP